MTIKPIPYCQTHNILNCRECFPSVITEKKQLPICKIHNIEGCLECWAVNKDKN